MRWVGKRAYCSLPILVGGRTLVGTSLTEGAHRHRPLLDEVAVYLVIFGRCGQGSKRSPSSMMRCLPAGSWRDASSTTWWNKWVEGWLGRDSYEHQNYDVATWSSLARAGPPEPKLGGVVSGPHV